MVQFFYITAEICSKLHPKASWERYMWAGYTSPCEVQHLEKEGPKKLCALLLFLCWWPQLYARVSGRKWSKWVVVLSHSHQQLSGAPQAGEKGISNVLWEVNKALGVSGISSAVLITSQGISLSFLFRPHMQTSDKSTNKICYLSVPWLLPKGDEAGLCQVAAQSYVCFMSEL